MRAIASVFTSLLLVTAPGCGAPANDPDAPDATPPAPHPDAAVPAPVDAAPAPGPDAAAPAPIDAAPAPDTGTDPPPDASANPINQHTDLYDPAGDRMLIAHCSRSAVLAIDLASGGESVIADQWPFPGSEHICPRALARAADGESFHAVVSHRYQDDGDSCVEIELVGISPQGQVTPVRTLSRICADGSEDYEAPLIDDAHGRIVLLRTHGVRGSNSELVGVTRETGERTLLLDIYDDSDGSPERLGQDLVFDPRAPDNRVLALIGHDHTIDVIDVPGRAREVLVTVQTDWDDGLEVVPGRLAVGTAGQRLFVIGRVATGHAVIAVDLATGAQTLVYDGAASAQGDSITCLPQVGFDTARNRLLMFVRGTASCTEGLYAVDVAGGTLTRLPHTPSAAP